MFSKRRIALFISVVLVLVAGVLIITSFAMADSNRKPERLIGAWAAELYPSGRPTFYALATFFADGNVAEDETGTGESSGHGVWVMDKKGQVRFTAVELLWDPANGDAYLGKFVIYQILDWDGKSGTWSGLSTVTMYDPTGAVVFSDTVPAKFTRIQLPPAL
jgi:hypothetical protein